MLIDFHSHILCGMDHGSSSLESSLGMLNEAKNIGIDIIVATPHFYPEKDNLTDFLQRRDQNRKKIYHACDSVPRIILGAEVALSVDLCKMPDLEKLCIEDTPYILLELPYRKWTYWVFEAVFYLYAVRGLRPIIAHVERYKNIQEVEKILSMDVLAQVNASSLLPFISMRRPVEMLKKGQVQLLGSDMHENTKAYRHFDRALKVLGHYGEEMMQNAQDILKPD